MIFIRNLDKSNFIQFKSLYSIDQNLLAFESLCGQSTGDTGAMQHGNYNPKVDTAQLCPFQLFRPPLCSLPGSCSGHNSNSGTLHTALLWIKGVSCGTLWLAHRMCTTNICCYYYHHHQGHCHAVYRVLVSPC